MDAAQWLDKFGEPKDWALAQAILEQIDEYRAAVRLVIEGVPPGSYTSKSNWMFSGKFTRPEERAAYALRQAEERVRRPVVDLNRAREKVGPIEESGGWMAFTPGVGD